jgi:hypothetical protein
MASHTPQPPDSPRSVRGVGPRPDGEAGAILHGDDRRDLAWREL